MGNIMIKVAIIKLYKFLTVLHVLIACVLLSSRRLHDDILYSPLSTSSPRRFFLEMEGHLTGVDWSGTRLIFPF